MDLERARGLSVREMAAVAAVRAHYAEHGRPPSCKEIAHRLGVRISYADRLVKAAATLGSLVVVRRRGVRTQIRLASPLAEIATIALAAELAARQSPAELAARQSPAELAPRQASAELAGRDPAAKVPPRGNEGETGRTRLAA